MLVYFWYPINRIQLYLYDCNTDCTAVIWDVYIIIYIYLSCVGWDINIVIKKQIVKPNAHSHDVCPPHLNDPRWSLITSCNIQFTIVDKQETMHHLECMYIYISKPWQNNRIPGYPPLKTKMNDIGKWKFTIFYRIQPAGVQRMEGLWLQRMGRGGPLPKRCQNLWDFWNFLLRLTIWLFFFGKFGTFLILYCTCMYISYL